jgi:predicted nucleic-acid-binding protein
VVRYLDTNAVLALVRDDSPLQTAVVDRGLRDAAEKGEVWILAESVVVELHWVLERVYGAPRHLAVQTIRAILECPQIQAWDAGLTSAALDLMEEEPELDMVDCLLAMRARPDGAMLLTFDEALRRAAAKA